MPRSSNLSEVLLQFLIRHQCLKLITQLLTGTNEMVPPSLYMSMTLPFLQLNRSNAALNAMELISVTSSMCTALVTKHTKMQTQLFVVGFACLPRDRPVNVFVIKGPAKSTPECIKARLGVTLLFGKLAITCSSGLH